MLVMQFCRLTKIDRSTITANISELAQADRGVSFTSAMWYPSMAPLRGSG